MYNFLVLSLSLHCSLQGTRSPEIRFWPILVVTVAARWVAASLNGRTTESHIRARATNTMLFLSALWLNSMRCPKKASVTKFLLACVLYFLHPPSVSLLSLPFPHDWSFISIHFFGGGGGGWETAWLSPFLNQLDLGKFVRGRESDSDLS